MNDLTAITNQFNGSVKELNFVAYDCKQIIGYLIVDGKVSTIITIISTSIIVPALALLLTHTHTHTHTHTQSLRRRRFSLPLLPTPSPQNLSLSLFLSLSLSVYLSIYLYLSISISISISIYLSIYHCCHVPRWHGLYLMHSR